MRPINGFSKLSKEEKIQALSQEFFRDLLHSHSDGDAGDFAKKFRQYWHPEADQQRLFDEFSENTLSNFYLPYCVAPNFLIDGKVYYIPMVIEESSVVAAAAKSAKFWFDRGGIKTEVLSTLKVGQIHFYWQGEGQKLLQHFLSVRRQLLLEVSDITRKMESRGGGIKDLELLDMTDLDPHYYQIKVSFDTCDAMGANFINSSLEKMAQTFKQTVSDNPRFVGDEKDICVIMGILSNYTPQCVVKAKVECPIEDLYKGLEGDTLGLDFVYKFEKAVKISKVDVFRATTHNKGIFNGIDAVALATGNDFRAVEANGHAYAARSGRYCGLTELNLENGNFCFSLELPLSLGTVGGLTSLHPLAKTSLQMLGNPSAEMLMRIAASVGLAQNFAALKSLVTTGIQKGHMKMHLLNMLNHFSATENEREEAKIYFQERIVSFKGVRELLERLRQRQ